MVQFGYCPQILSNKIFYVLVPPQVVWLPTYLLGFLYTSFHPWMFTCRSQAVEGFLKDRSVSRIPICLCQLLPHRVPPHPLFVIQFVIFSPSNSHAHFNRMRPGDSAFPFDYFLKPPFHAVSISSLTSR